MKRGDAMMLGLVMGATAHGDESAASSVEIAQRQATDALVENLRTQVVKLERRLQEQTKSFSTESADMFDDVMKACLTEIEN